MAKTESFGTCSFCKERVTKRTASRHLQHCQARKRAEDALIRGEPECEEVEVYHLVVESRWEPDSYWLHIAVRADAPLHTLDQFLRDIWLECCGHLSMFKIHGAFFESGGFGDWSEGLGMGVAVERVLEPKLRFDYTYDMGDSTDLRLRVVGVSTRPDAVEEVVLLARNEDPGIHCSHCENAARWICTECMHTGEGWLCEECGAGHPCSPEMRLPVVNSPRVGVCAYCGPQESAKETGPAEPVVISVDEEEEDDAYRYADLVDLLMERPDTGVRRWAGAIVFRILETGGSSGYRYDDDRLNHARFRRIASESLVAAYKALREPERDLLLRLLLLVPWELNVRHTGLPLRVSDVLDVMGGIADPAELEDAVGDAIEAGPKALAELELGEVLPEERGAGTGLVLELSEEEGRMLRVRPGRFEFDRLDVAVAGFRPYRWEAGLRRLVPWWLDALRGAARDQAVTEQIEGLCLDPDDGAGRFCLLGLLDWMCGNPGHAQAGVVLELGLGGKDGPPRKAAAELAAAMGRADVLDDLARNDPDRGVRARAEKLLAALGPAGSAGQFSLDLGGDE